MGIMISSLGEREIKTMQRRSNGDCVQNEVAIPGNKDLENHLSDLPKEIGR
jgi:hypothetical protein